MLEGAELNVIPVESRAERKFALIFPELEIEESADGESHTVKVKVVDRPAAPRHRRGRLYRPRVPHDYVVSIRPAPPNVLPFSDPPQPRVLCTGADPATRRTQDGFGL
jgi:hypothetical protein